MVYRRARGLLGGDEDAQDATQEVFVRVMRSLAQFDHRCTMETWLYQITTNYCLDVLRQRGKRQWKFTDQQSSVDLGVNTSVSDLVYLRQLLSRADADQARAVIYVYVDGMSHEQAADVIGTSKRTVGNLVERFLSWARKRSGVRGEVGQVQPNTALPTKASR
jgi:RNA polymerase sigma-70 factor (ECF subfamily)